MTTTHIHVAKQAVCGQPTQESNTRSEDVEELVRQRVAEELKREKANNDQAYSELAKSNLEKDYNSVAMGTDIENMIQRVQRYDAKWLNDERNSQ